jgi:phosphoesterase RecJ-like protein
MNSKDLKTLRELLVTPSRITIVPHKNPDGDAIGSSLALWHYLNSLGHTARVISPNDYPKFLKWMPGTLEVLNFERENELALDFISASEIIFTLDFNMLSRAGNLREVLEASVASFVMIDHHREPGDYAAVTFSDIGMSSTCEMVYSLIESMGDLDKIGPEIANCLYAGILTDTGSFKYSATSSRTHRVVAELIDRGADNTGIHRNIFDTISPDRLKLLGCALNNMVIREAYHTAYITLTQDELDRYQYKKGDTEGFVNYGLTLEGIHFAAIFIENREEGIIKISFRSHGDFSVNDFARAYFGGGGHMNAAGGRSHESMDETISRFESLLESHKEELTT